MHHKTVKEEVGKLTPAPELRKKGLGAVELVPPGEGVDDEDAGDRVEEVIGPGEEGVEGGQRPAMREGVGERAECGGEVGEEGEGGGGEVVGWE